jgi:valyl-tRNA synthetase
VIDMFGADALRYGMTYLTTETQDVRMPVQFECPHCQALVDQTRKNRELPRITCPKCSKAFSTQWARTLEDQALPRGFVVSERFELGRNFCNKLWNAARFALINMPEFAPGPVSDADLKVEDRWVLSRLATVTQEVTAALEEYHYSDAARALYDFAWDEFCSFYVEMVKQRLQDDASRVVAQRVLAHTLDVLLRLLHPIIPFITEEIWQLFAKAAPRRGLPQPQPAAESVMIAAWPQADLARRNPEIEEQFELFQKALGALREIRATQNIAHKNELVFSVRCAPHIAELLRPMEPYFASMANAHSNDWGEQIDPPKINATISLPGMDLFVDLVDYIDVEAECTRLRKQQEKIAGLIHGKQKKLSNPAFVDKAPAEVVARERESLEELNQQMETIRAALSEMCAQSG